MSIFYFGKTAKYVMIICMEEGRVKIYPSLYIGKTVNNPDKTISRLKKHSRLLSAYVITLSNNPSDQLEIHSAADLAQKYYRKYPPYVIGIASDYDEAVELVRQIAEESYAAQGDCRLKEYLFSKNVEN